ncbi:hypothetical protein HDU97_001425 [Phlyctochytrium planicorne]|nr:hypothetical protein HDU97_001425 [Phlyctochytrium planicorne]
MLHFIRIFLLPLCEIAIICLLILKSCSNDKDHPQCFYGDAALAALDPQTNGDGSYLTWGQVTTYVTIISFFHTGVRLIADDSAKALFEVMARFQVADRNLIPDVPMIWRNSRFEPAGEKITKRGRKTYRLAWHNLYDTVQFFRSLLILLIVRMLKVFFPENASSENEEIKKSLSSDPDSTKPTNFRTTVLLYIGFSILLLGFALKLAAVAVISSPVQRNAAELMAKLDKAASAVADHEKHRLLQTRNLTRTTFGDLKAWVRFDEEQKKPVLHVDKETFYHQTPMEERANCALRKLRDLDFPETGQTQSEEMFTRVSYSELGNAVGFLLAPAFLWAVWSHNLTWWFTFQMIIVVLASGFFRLFIRVTSSYVASGYLMSKYKRLQRQRNVDRNFQAPAAPSQPMAQPRVSSLPSEPVPPPNAEIHAAPSFVSSTAPSAVSSYPPSQAQQLYTDSNPASYPPYNPTQPFDCRTTFVNQYHQQQQQQAGYTPQNPYAQNANAPMHPYQPGPSGFIMSPFHVGANAPSTASFSTLAPDQPDPLEPMDSEPSQPQHPKPRIPNAYVPPTTTPTDPLSSVTRSSLNTALWIRWFLNAALAGILSSAYALLLPFSYSPKRNILVNIVLTIPTVVMFLAIFPYYFKLWGPRAVFYDLMFDHLTGVRCRLMIEETEKREKEGKVGLGEGKNEKRK